MGSGYAAEDLLVNQFLQSIQRQDNIGILVRVAVVIIIVSNDKIIEQGSGIQFPAARIAVGVTHVKWGLMSMMDAGSRDQRQLRLRQGNRWRYPGNSAVTGAWGIAVGKHFCQRWKTGCPTCQ